MEQFSQTIIHSRFSTICTLASSHFLISNLPFFHSPFLAFGGWGSLDAGNEELLKMISELQSELEAVKAEHVSEKKKVHSLISSSSILKLSLTFAAGDCRLQKRLRSFMQKMQNSNIG